MFWYYLVIDNIQNNAEHSIQSPTFKFIYISYPHNMSFMNCTGWLYIRGCASMSSNALVSRSKATLQHCCVALRWELQSHGSALAGFLSISTVRAFAGLERGGDSLLLLFAPVSHSNTSSLQQQLLNLVCTCSNSCGPASSWTLSVSSTRRLAWCLRSQIGS